MICFALVQQSARGQATRPATTTAATASREVTLADGFERIVPVMIDADSRSSPTPPHFALGGPLAMGIGRVLMFYSPGKNIHEQREIRVAESRDLGRTWRDDRAIERNPDDTVRHGRPLALLDRDGQTIHVFYYGWIRYGAEPDNSRSNVWTLRSTDGGRAWSERQLVWNGGFNGVVQPPIQTRTGRILLPFAYLAGTSRFVGGVARSNDAGRTWDYTGGIEVPANADALPRSKKLSGGALEPTIANLADGTVLMLIRTVTGVFWQSTSSDDGTTWSPPTPTALGCGGTGVLFNLPGDRLLFVFNPPDAAQVEKRGYPHGMDAHAFCISSDGGRTWSPAKVFARG